MNKSKEDVPFSTFTVSGAVGNILFGLALTSAMIMFFIFSIFHFHEWDWLGCVLSLVFVIPLGIGIFILGASLLVFKQTVKLQKEGQTITGEIQESWKKEIIGRNGTKIEYYVKYSFTVMGKSYLFQQEVKEREYRMWGKGTSVNVKCLPDNPNFARIMT
jgi:hypothetical protein